MGPIGLYGRIQAQDVADIQGAAATDPPAGPSRTRSHRLIRPEATLIVARRATSIRLRIPSFLGGPQQFAARG